MSVLSSKTKRNDYKLVGVSLPPHLHSYITLYTFSNDVTKSAILQELIEEWVAKQRKKISEEMLMYEITKRANIQWKVKKTTGTKMTFQEYTKEFERELILKGLSTAQVTVIINGIKE